MEGLAFNRPTAPLGSHNSVLRGRGRAHFVKDYPGPLSIKSVTEGAVAWKTGRRDLLVDAGAFLVLNHGEPYSICIDSRVPVETLCAFFQPGFVESVRHSIEHDDAEPGGAPVEFAAALQPADARILPRLRSIAAARDVSQLWLDEQYLALARDLLLLERDVARRVRTLPGRRPSTRDELFHRIRRGQEYLHAHAMEDLDLHSLAREACLSTYHFHRAFTRVFGVTPHEYRTRLRLDRARRMLEATDRTVTEICGAVGFESLASFSLLFRRSFGESPAALRKSSKIR